MHQVHRNNSNSRQRHWPIRLEFLLASVLDCQAMSMLFSRLDRFQVVDCVADVEFGLARFQRKRPDVLLVDPKASPDLLERVSEVMRPYSDCHLIVLDDRLHESRLAAVLKLPRTSYITRQSGMTVLHSAIERVVGNQRVFDPSIANRIQRTSVGLRLEYQNGKPSIASLTAREEQIMRLLAEGLSVKDCATQLGLALSTADNHKSRLMKKLRLRSSSQLTYRAIYDGLVTF